MASIVPPDRNELRRYLGSLRPLIESAAAMESFLNREYGTAFHIAAYAVNGLEVRLNRILADLLNPRGLHGQGGHFLKLFLAMLGPRFPAGGPDSWLATANFRTMKGRYIDLVVRDGRRAIVGIESKPWATESKDQLEDYAKDLIACGCEQCWLVFLPARKGPRKTSLQAETRQTLGVRFVEVPFTRSDDGDGRSIVEWLQRCAAECRAANVRAFVADLAAYLDKEFPVSGKERAMTQLSATDMIVSMTKADGESIMCALLVADAAGQLRRTIADEFVRLLVEKLAAKAPDTWVVDTCHFRNFKPLTGKELEYIIYRKRDWPESWGVCLEWSTNEMTDFTIGFTCPAQGQGQGRCANGAECALIRAAVEHEVRIVDDKVKADDWWPAKTPLKHPFRDWREAQTFVLLAGRDVGDDGQSAIATFLGWFGSIAEAAAPTVDDILQSSPHSTGGA